MKLQASACNFIKKETLAQVFSCEFCENTKNSFSYRTPPVATFIWWLLLKCEATAEVVDCGKIAEKLTTHVQLEKVNIFIGCSTTNCKNP